MMLQRLIAAGALSVAVLALSACASQVKRQPAVALTAVAAAQAPVYQLKAPVSILLSTRYKRELATGSKWRLAGTLPQGDVLRPVGTVFTIEGHDVHEAWLVARDAKLIGFYLPAEQAYSPLRDPLPLELGDLQ